MPTLEQYQRIDGQKAFMMVFMLSALDLNQFIFGITIMGEFFWLGPAAPLLADVASIPFSVLAYMGLWIALRTSNVGVISRVHAIERRMIIRFIILGFEVFGGPFFPGWPLYAFIVFRASRREDKAQFEKALEEWRTTGVVQEALPLGEQ